MNRIEKARANRIDKLICDRIETLVNHAKQLEASDPELADWLLLEAMEFAEEIDSMDETDSIFWCKPII